VYKTVKKFAKKVTYF